MSILCTKGRFSGCDSRKIQRVEISSVHIHISTDDVRLWCVIWMISEILKSVCFRTIETIVWSMQSKSSGNKPFLFLELQKSHFGSGIDLGRLGGRYSTSRCFRRLTEELSCLNRLSEDTRNHHLSSFGKKINFSRIQSVLLHYSWSTIPFSTDSADVLFAIVLISYLFDSRVDAPIMIVWLASRIRKLTLRCDTLFRHSMIHQKIKKATLWVNAKQYFYYINAN